MKKWALLLPLAVAAAISAQSAAHRGQMPAAAVVFTQVPFGPGRHQEKPGQFLLNRATDQDSRIVLMAADGSVSVLTPEFSAASDPSVSFDGLRIVFSGRKIPSDPWNIWEMDLDGRNKRQITKGLGNCREPEYLARSGITPPDFADKVRWITFVSTPGAGPSSLYVTNLEPSQGRGVVTWRTTFSVCSDFSPTVLRDGRVLFTSQEGCGAPDGGSFPLLAANWDGSGLNLFCDARQGARFKTMACETPDRDLVFVESSSPGQAGGTLARVSFRRPLQSYAVLSRDGGQYLNPHSFPDGRLAVSYTAGKESYGLYLFDSEKGSVGTKLFADAAWDSLDPQPVVVKAEPQGLISSVVDTLDWGDLFCLNVYESDAARIGKGEVKAVRFSAPDRVLGEAPVEDDGSFFVRIPADTPFSMQLLGGNGQVLRRMQRSIWVRRGTSRGCIGCHENKELAPENRVPAAILRGEPHDLTSVVRH